VPPAEATLKFRLQQAEALRQLNAWGGQPLPLNASCWLGEEAARCTCACAARSRRWRRPAARWAASARTTRAPPPTGNAAASSNCPGSPRARARALWRLSVPQTAPVLDAPEPPLVEWHGGQRWVRAAPGHAARVREIARAAGGHATLFRCRRAHARAALRRRWPRRWPPSTARSSASSIRRHLQPRPAARPQ
jgi:glycolate oxidase FAD binding subunit